MSSPKGAPISSSPRRDLAGAKRASFLLEQGACLTSPNAQNLLLSTKRKGNDGSAPEDLDKELSSFARKAAGTFAPRASTKQKNPAFPGSALYTIFEVQAYASIAVGGLLSFNVLFPSDGPDVWRLMGMWSVWMFAIPSLRARDCPLREKDALNLLFLLVPVVNVLIPLFWKVRPRALLIWGRPRPCDAREALTRAVF